MSDPHTTPPPFGDGQPPSGPPPAPGVWGAPTPPTPPPAPPAPPPAPGQWGAPTPPPAPWGTPASSPPPPGQAGWGQPGAFQQPAQPYQYGVGLPHRADLAEPGTRIIARIIDWFIMLVVLIPLYLILIGSASSIDSGVGSGLFFGGSFLLMLAVTVGQVLYEVAFIAVKGQTPGKMLMKVKVVRDSDGQIPGWGPAFMRWVPNLVNLVPCFGGILGLGLIIWALVNLFSNPKRQTPFDLAAGTVVITAR